MSEVNNYTRVTGTSQHKEPNFSQTLYSIIRDVEYSNLTLDQIESNNLELDSDILVHHPDSDEIYCANKEKYIDNSYFSNANEIDCYLRYWGKIPEFLELKESAGKGYGIFAKTDIAAGTFLGQYQGIPRLTEHGIDPKGLYLFTLKDFNYETKGTIDGQNITYANFTRFINHSDEHNCSSRMYPGMICIYTKVFIPTGIELTINYGNDYWQEIKAYGIDKS